MPIVNDVHSQLNPTRVREVVRPRDVEDLGRALDRARGLDLPIAIAGSRHAMGGQQFVDGGVLVDTRGLNRVLDLDAERGLVTMESGTEWPDLVADLTRRQRGRACPWSIVQKQTGADRLTIAGALSCNAHGRGLTLGPIVGQVESFDLMDHTGAIRTCSRDREAPLFALAIGGYGLFGVITRVALRLRRRVKVRRVVRLAHTIDLMTRFDERERDGYLYGDFQFVTDESSRDFLRRGIFSCYEPVTDDTPLTRDPVCFQPDEWSWLIERAHDDKRLAFDAYAARYLQTSEQIYWADDQWSAAYVDDYHAAVDRALGAHVKGTEMITEIYVPRARFAPFMEDARRLLREVGANLIYGTVRVIERDDETMLAWARERFACIVFNLHVDHTWQAVDRSIAAFRALIDLGIDHGGSYYLTYHRWARRDQVEHCYPQMREFLALKLRHDPAERFQSAWYRHYREMLLGVPAECCEAG